MFLVALMGFFGMFSDEAIYEKISQKIQQRYQVEVLKPMGIGISAIGGSSKKGIKMIHMGVSTRGPGSVKEARKLMVFLFTELLNRYKNNTAIRPYLLDDPFTEKNIEFSIRFVDSKGIYCRKDKSKNDEDQVAYVTCYNGRVKFMVDDEGGLTPFRPILIESFQDALRIAQKSR